MPISSGMEMTEEIRAHYTGVCREHLQAALVKHRDDRDADLTTDELTALVWFKVGLDQY